MDDSQPQFLEVGAGTRRRRIAYRRRGGKGPELLWLSGFLSDMASTKATAIAEWAAEQGLAMMRFDYSGHGLSGGDLLNASIGDWLEESMAVWELMGERPAHRHRLVHGRVDRAAARAAPRAPRQKLMSSPASC